MSTTSLPAGSLGADYAGSSSTMASRLKQAGARFVCRYLSISADSWKTITASERDQIFGAGLGLLLNWEVGSSDWQKSAEAASWGGQAASAAKGLGYPASLPIIVSIDTSLSSSQVGQAVDYLQKFKAAASPYPLGVYGASTVVNAIGDDASFVWATNATSWGSDFDRTVNIQQHTNNSSKFPQFASFGNEIDVDEALTPIEVWGSVSGGTGGGDTPPSGDTTYTVQPGDSWWSIAEKELGSGSKSEELAAYNGMTTSDVIHPGQILKIPPS